MQYTCATLVKAVVSISEVRLDLLVRCIGPSRHPQAIREGEAEERRRRSRKVDLRYWPIGCARESRPRGAAFLKFHRDAGVTDDLTHGDHITRMTVLEQTCIVGTQCLGGKQEHRHGKNPAHADVLFFHYIQ